MNIPLESKSKEEYRKKLSLKKDILDQSNVDYYILLPPDMNIENYKKIFSLYLKEAV